MTPSVANVGPDCGHDGDAVPARPREHAPSAFLRWFQGLTRRGSGVWAPALLVLAGVGLALPLRAEPVDVLLVASDDGLLKPVLGKLGSVQHETRAAWEFWSGAFSDKRIALTRSEGDPLNAVAATTLAVRTFHPRLVVVYGAARAHDPALRAGDVVVSGKFAPFDGMVSPVTPIDGGSHPLRWEKEAFLAMTPGERETAVFAIPADPAAVALASKLTAPRGRVVVGVLGSANQVNREADRVAWLREEWHTSTEDGESAHVAACASLLGVPVVGFRVVDGTAGDASAFVLKFLEAWK